MAKQRIRSPNYPAIGLPEAIQRVKQIYGSQHIHSADRETVAISMGYSGLNGASASAISALTKYGLLDGRAEDIKVSDRAMKILFPKDEQEKEMALREAALAPPLFREIAEKFPGKMPSDAVLQSHLARNGFATGAVSAVIQSYKDTMATISQESPTPGGGAADDHIDEGLSGRKPADGAEGKPAQEHEDPPPADRGKFRVSMDDEFRVDISATKLGKDGVEKLIKYLEANKGLVSDDIS